jgi:predicted permease
MGESRRSGVPFTWRLLRRLLPRRFRALYGDEMYAMHLERGSARGWSRLRTWYSLTSDVLRTSWGVRFDALRRTAPEFIAAGWRRGMDAARMDVGYAVRQLWRAPVFTLVASISLAVGIGVTVAALAVTRAVMFQPLPVQDASHLYRVYSGHMHARTMFRYDKSTYAEYERYRSSGIFGDVAAVSSRSVVITGPGLRPQSHALEFVTPNYFPMLGVSVQRGRWFGDTDEHEIVIAADFWRRVLGGSTDVLGRTIRVDGSDFTIVGIGPDPFTGATRPLGDAPAGWIDIGVDAAMTPAAVANPLVDNRYPRYSVLARLAPGQTPVSTRARLESLPTSMGDTGTDSATAAWKGGRIVSLLSDGESRILPGRRKEAAIGFGIGGLLVSVVLLIGCANVAGLMLARTMSRQHEVGVRLILGATTRRMFAQLFTESILISVLGGVLGSIGAYAALRIARQFPEAAALGIRVDPVTLAIALLVSLLTTLLFGLTPILQSLRSQRRLATSSTHSGSVAVNRSRARVLTIQIAASFILVLMAMYGVRGVRAQLAADPGFSPRGLVVGEVPMYHFRDTTAATRYLADLRELIARTPGVQIVGFGEFAPMATNGWRTSSTTMDNGEKASFAFWTSVDGEYLEALNIPVRGRLMRSSDTLRARPVAVVDEVYARGYHVEAGSMIDMGRNRPPLEVIGVVGTVLSHEANELPQPVVYQAQRRTASPYGRKVAVLRVTPGREAAIALDLQKRIAQRWPDNLPPQMESMASYIRNTTTAARVLSNAALTIAAIELALAGVGLYGMQLYTVLARWRELGVRLALGATRNSAVRAILGGSVRSVILGLVVGSIGAIPAMMLFKRSLVAVRVSDPVPFIAAALTVSVAVAIASLVPARRAASVSPAAALRHD